MEHRKNRHFWLKLAVASVSYGAVISLIVHLWKLHIAPGIMSKGDSEIWIVFASLAAVLTWGAAPAVAALLLLGRLYRMNFFLEFWHGRERQYDFAARSFAMAIPVVSGLMSSAWQIFGGDTFDLGLTATTVGGSLIGAFPVVDSIVHGERTLAERVAGRADAEEAGT